MALLTQDEIDAALADADGWELDGTAIVKQFERGDFAGSVRFVDTVLPVAEAMSHHPDVAISWATVTITVTSHSAGGLTADDFELARRIDAVA